MDPLRHSISYFSPPSPAKQMAYLYPRFYNCSVPAAFSADLPQLAQLCEGTKPTLASDKSAQQLFTIRGDKFLSFVKSESFVDGKIFLTYSWSFAAVQRIYTVLMYCNKSTFWEFLGTFLKILLTYLTSLCNFQKTLLFVVE